MVCIDDANVCDAFNCTQDACIYDACINDVCIYDTVRCGVGRTKKAFLGFRRCAKQCTHWRKVQNRSVEVELHAASAVNWLIVGVMEVEWV